MDSVQRLLQLPVLTQFGIWIACRGAENLDFTGREVGIAKGVFNISLLEYSFALDSETGHETEGHVLKDRSVALMLCPFAILKVTKGDDA